MLMLNALVNNTNELGFKLRARLRPHYKNPVFIFLVKTYFRHIIGLIRKFVPLYGISAIVSITYRCQCTCVHCGAGLFRQNKDEELKPEEIFTLIDEIGRLGAAAIHFFGGEPLLVAELPQYVKRAKARRLLASVDTNGLLLDEKKALELKEAGIDIIRVSIDSPSPEEHDKLRGVPGVFKKGIEGLKFCKKHGINCAMSLVATAENLKNGDLEKLIAFSRSMGVRVRILASIATGKWLEKKNTALDKAGIEKLRSLLNEDVCWETEFLNSSVIPFWCNSLIRNKFDVSAYGDVQACCYLPITYGNIRKEPIAKILEKMWKSELFESRREHYDCPMNDPAFRTTYGNLMKSEIDKQSSAASSCRK